MGYKIFNYNYKYSDYKLKSRFFVCIVFISDKKNDSNYNHASNNVRKFFSVHEENSKTR